MKKAILDNISIKEYCVICKGKECAGNIATINVLMEIGVEKSYEVSESEIEIQKAIMQRIREIFGLRQPQPLAYVDTYGCQQNEADSEKLRGMLVEMGYGLTGDEFKADIAIVNTCAIRENAENRVLGNVGALIHTKTANRKQLIVFCGCLAGVPETVEKVRESYKHVGLVFPPNNIWRFPELLYRALTERKRIFETENEQYVITEGLPSHRDGKVKAWLPIMYGCNNFCSYCIVPYVRGRERSRRAEVILEEARELVAAGYKDITLLGQNVNSYKCNAKTDFALHPGNDFAALIRRINDIDGEFLIRFMTSHPKDASIELFRAMAESEKAARHIHLPFQAGNDRILKLMNRGYTHTEYLEKIAAARELMPDIVITSDVIVGYPGETEEEFNDTLKLVEAAQFEAMFTFIYSKRPGTPAAELPDTVTREEKQIRFERLVELQNEISEKKHEEYVGKTVCVLVDGEARDEAYPLRARTNGWRLVHLLGEPSLIGKFVEARIVYSNNWSLFGEVEHADNEK
jgi:tRNA-2-methylthio-N6-dimethylallyladenosine synthase